MNFSGRGDDLCDCWKWRQRGNGDCMGDETGWFDLERDGTGEDQKLAFLHLGWEWWTVAQGMLRCMYFDPIEFDHTQNYVLLNTILDNLYL